MTAEIERIVDIRGLIQKKCVEVAESWCRPPYIAVISTEIDIVFREIICKFNRITFIYLFLYICIDRGSITLDIVLRIYERNHPPYGWKIRRSVTET